MAQCCLSWQSTAMPNLPDGPQPPTLPPTTPRRAGGCLIAAGLLIGPVVGLFFHQTSLGLVIGFGIGVIAAIAMAMTDKR
jgi:hypothetical protein